MIAKHQCKLIGFIYLLCIIHLQSSVAYKIGLGRADCTGPPVEIYFMGYAELHQRGEGIHLRQFARTFIVQNDDAPDRSRIVYVTVEAGMVAHEVRTEILKRLQQKYDDIYRLDNVMISGTHTHSGPGGFLMDLLYHLPTLGFVKQTYNALVNGIYMSIEKAHEDMKFGYIKLGKTTVMDANINRSPASYLKNPESERKLYEFDVDKTLVQLQFLDENRKIRGVFNWFAVHPVSMNNTNRYVSSDNLGFAALQLEEFLNFKSLPGKGPIIGAFGSTNLGDVSPNIMGPKCELTGEPCDFVTSSCPKGHGVCFASGPGKNMYESTKIIGTRIANGAKDALLNSQHTQEVNGKIRNIHQFLDMTKAKTKFYDPDTNVTKIVQGCSPAMGEAFAAGTTDGPGVMDYKQGENSDNVLWTKVVRYLIPPTEEDIACQNPKPILLATGKPVPYQWQPHIIPLQAFQIGNIILVGVPGEYTTMSGRRLKRNIKDIVQEKLGVDMEVIIAGLSNMYTSYIATPEEYQLQRYEGASTIFGPYTQPIQLARLRKLINLMISDNKTDPGPNPPPPPTNMFDFNTPVYFDWHPLGKSFGSVIQQPKNKYQTGTTVRSSFTAANPRNNLRHEGTYFTVEFKSNDTWTVVRTDANWNTKFHWRRTNTVFGYSEIDFFWNIESHTEPGIYRINHYGSYKPLFTGPVEYEGTTMEFEIVDSDNYLQRYAM